MKILLMYFLVFLLNAPTSGEVYICVSKTASKYHYSETCRGLSACTHKVEKTTIKEAKNRGYKTLCGWED